MQGYLVAAPRAPQYRRSLDLPVFILAIPDPSSVCARKRAGDPLVPHEPKIFEIGGRGAINVYDINKIVKHTIFPE